MPGRKPDSEDASNSDGDNHGNDDVSLANNANGATGLSPLPKAPNLEVVL